MQKVKSILSTLLIPIVLWAGMGFSLNRHYCLGMLVDEAWYFVSEQCSPEHSEAEDSPQENICSSFPCCSDQWVSIAGVSVNAQLVEDESENSLQLEKHQAQLKEISQSPSYSFEESGTVKKSNGPPICIKEIVIEYQRFLI